MQEQQKIQMVDLHGQYMRIKAEVDAAVAEVIGTVRRSAASPRPWHNTLEPPTSSPAATARMPSR